MNNATDKIHGAAIDFHSLPEADFPAHLHGKIMKRVFFAGYGKYLYLSSGVLFLNLGVLGRELWRTAMELHPFKESMDLSVMTDSLSLLPFHVAITLAVTAAATAYAFGMIWNLHKEYKAFVFAK